MNPLFVFKNKKYKKIYFWLVLLFTFSYFLFKNLTTSIYIVNVPLFTLGQKVSLFFSALFDTAELKYIPMLILVLLFILSISFFFLLIFILLKNSKEVSKGKNFFGTFSIFLSILGLSCASCGLGLLASLLSFFGVSSLITYFPLHGLELGYLGVIFLNISNYFLLKKVKKPFVC